MYARVGLEFRLRGLGFRVSCWAGFRFEGLGALGLGLRV